MPRLIKTAKKKEDKDKLPVKMRSVHKFDEATASVVETIRAEIRRTGKIDFNSISLTLAQEFSNDLRRMIEKQTFAWAPLSPGYAARKRMLGLDPRILIATGRYVNSIQPIKESDGSYVVGVPNTPLSETSKATLKDLARWLEYGTAKMPPRPHWRPVKAQWKTKFNQVKLALKHEITLSLRKKGFR